MPDTYRYPLRLPPGLAAEISELAHLHRQSFNNEVIRATEAWIAQNQQTLDSAKESLKWADEQLSRRLRDSVQQVDEQSLRDSVQQVDEHAMQAVIRDVQAQAQLATRDLAAALKLLADPSMQATIRQAQEALEQARRFGLIPDHPTSRE